MVEQSLDLISNIVNNKCLTYASVLIASVKKKSCVQIAEQLSVSRDSIYRALQDGEKIMHLITDLLLQYVKAVSPDKRGWLVIDDTMIAKNFAKIIEGIDYIYDASTGHHSKGFAIVTIAWTDGTMTIPLGFKVWSNKEILGKFYKTKIQLAQELLQEILPKGLFEGVLADGLYASSDMINFLNDMNVKFNMRTTSNRVIILDNGKKFKLRDLLSLRPLRNARCRNSFAHWRGMVLYFTSELRINHKGEKTLVFIVSNYDTLAKSHVEAYRLRWCIESMPQTYKKEVYYEYKLRTYV